jgi:hypothetical protein
MLGIPQEGEAIAARPVQVAISITSNIANCRRIVAFGNRIETLLDATIVFRLVCDGACAKQWDYIMPSADVSDWQHRSVCALNKAAMKYTQAGDIAGIISNTLAICVFGLLLFGFAITVRKRRLAIWELMIYVAGAGVTFAIPGCFRLRGHRYFHVTHMYFDANWFSLGLCYLSLSMILLLIYRQSRR